MYFQWANQNTASWVRACNKKGWISFEPWKQFLQRQYGNEMNPVWIGIMKSSGSYYFDDGKEVSSFRWFLFYFWSRLTFIGEFPRHELDRFMENSSKYAPIYYKNWIASLMKFLVDEFSRNRSCSCPRNWKFWKKMDEFLQKSVCVTSRKTEIWKNLWISFPEFANKG